MSGTLLFTGASGFLGGNVKLLLLGQYEINTVGIGAQEDYKVNLSNDIPNLDKYYDIVLHAAGKAHVVPRTKAEEQAFFDINYQGTMNLCKALEVSGVPKSFIFISTVAVYGCENGEGITEEHPLNGDTPYAKSKIQAEQFLNDWCAKNGVILSILRPSLIAGPNAPGNLGAMVDGIKRKRYLSIGGGKTRKSVLMIEDIARLVPLLASKGGVYNVCDNTHPSFRELEQVICKQLNCTLPLNIPMMIAKCMALIGDLLGSKAPINSNKLKKITENLTFSNEKAKRELGWKPLPVLQHYKIR